MKGFIIALAGLLTLGGCAASRPPSFTVSADRYEAAFDIAKEELQRLGFDLVRVDARGGVIATDAVSTPGLITPWTRTEASIGAETQSFMERDQRRVLIVFDPSQAVAEEEWPGVDRRAVEGDLVCRVSASREILHRPGLRLSSEAVRLSSVTRSDASEDFTEETISRSAGEDEALSRKLARRIEQRLAKGADRG